ncbi:hypothetical protein T484DRAFT_1963241 [Baffinella frigidus]|nr:hypothetical protein T484DRAFT_1963241 [Cryptophyta sp. CCMP2293]
MTMELWHECPADAPYAELEGKGEWLPSKQVTQHKSFGKFCCKRCKKSWRSAHAFGGREFQQCKTCKLKLPAKWRWQTTSASPRSSSSEEERPTGAGAPHRQALCSVCVRLGRPCWNRDALGLNFGNLSLS